MAENRRSVSDEIELLRTLLAYKWLLAEARWWAEDLDSYWGDYGGSPALPWQPLEATDD